MKSVLISIRPKWCEPITNGKKTIEIRKTKPKLDAPFKVYIYCTLPPKSEFFWHHDEEGKRTIGENARELLKLPNGQIVYDYGMRLACEEGEYTQNNFLCRKVIGEFVCDAIISHCEMANADIAEQQGFIKREELFEYANGKELYGWHISDLVIYDKPKELSEFSKPYGTVRKAFESRFVTSPPQSWCYVESEE